MLMNIGATIYSGRPTVDRTLAAMQEMERYFAARPNSPAAIRHPSCPFAAGLLLRYSVQVLRRVSRDLATRFKERYARLTCNIRVPLGHLLITNKITRPSRGKRIGEAA